MKLHELSPAEGSKKSVKRSGRGAGAGGERCKKRLLFDSRLCCQRTGQIL